MTTAQLRKALLDATINTTRLMENQPYQSWYPLHRTRYRHHHNLNITAMMHTANLKSHPSK